MRRHADDSMFFVAEHEVTNCFLTTDFERLEQPEYQKNRLDFLFLRLSESIPIRMTHETSDIVQSVATIVISLVLAFPVFIHSGWVTSGSTLALLVLSVWCSMRIQGKRAAARFDFAQKNILGNRLFTYVGELSNRYRVGMEVRVFRLQALLRKISSGISVELITNWQRREGRYNATAAILSHIARGTLYAIVALRALAGIYPIGSVVQYVGALIRLSSSLTDLVAKLSNLHTNLKHYETYFAILDAQPIKYVGTLSTEKRDDAEYDIEFHDVSFKYPGSEEYALQNLNLRLRIGQHLAVVGMNGSGKTTMIKLLCRLYDPTAGTITLNDIDIRKYDLRQYMDLFSVVFQDFKLFSYTLGENVAASTEFDRARVIDCCEKAGYSNPDPNMVLYKDLNENGVEISGGEAQKLALARALYRDAPFMVLDEPTAALDPVAEFEIYTRFHSLMAGHTAIYISHRLSSCRFCDDIAVFHEGRLVQRGNHDTLLTQGGKYAELWHAQAQYYAEA